MHGSLSDSFGISDGRAGLPCRADRLCHFVSKVVNDLAGTLAAAVLVRNNHEQLIHQYVHVPIRENNWAFTQRFSKQGRSTITKGKRA